MTSRQDQHRDPALRWQAALIAGLALLEFGAAVLYFRPV